MHVKMSECIALLDKMAAFSQVQSSNARKFVPKGPIYNKPAMVLVRAWCWRGIKPLPEQMLNQFTDVSVWHWGR